MAAESTTVIPARDIERYHAAAVQLAAEARSIVKPALERGFAVETKADASLVTDVDRGIERRLRELIERWFPDHGVIGEEYPPTQPDSPFQWIMDPIDGTEEFIHGIPTWGAMLALHHRGAPLVGVIDHPALDLSVSAARGIGAYKNGQRFRLPAGPASQRPEAVRLVLSARINFTRHVDEGFLFEGLTRRYPNHRIYRAAYAHTAVVMGAADAMVDMHNHVWDLAPSQVLIEEAGGRYAVVRDFPAPDGERMLSAVFGQPAVVDSLAVMFQESIDRGEGGTSCEKPSPALAGCCSSRR
jgi:fructose-1,6-bisphosphatase/inositol monophosphatase family enzyme